MTNILFCLFTYSAGTRKDGVVMTEVLKGLGLLICKMFVSGRHKKYEMGIGINILFGGFFHIWTRLCTNRVVCCIHIFLKAKYFFPPVFY